METKNYLDAIDPVDAEAGREADAAGGRRDRDFLVQRSRFLAALKTRLAVTRSSQNVAILCVNSHTNEEIYRYCLRDGRR